MLLLALGGKGRLRELSMGQEIMDASSRFPLLHKPDSLVDV